MILISVLTCNILRYILDTDSIHPLVFMNWM